jgi:hypothetical protein
VNIPTVHESAVEVAVLSDCAAHDIIEYLAFGKYFVGLSRQSLHETSATFTAFDGMYACPPESRADVGSMQIQ